MDYNPNADEIAYHNRRTREWTGKPPSTRAVLWDIVFEARTPHVDAKGNLLPPVDLVCPPPITIAMLHEATKPYWVKAPEGNKVFLMHGTIRAE